MDSTDTYINIHTHQPLNDESVAILNILPEQGIPQEATGKLFFSCGIHPWYIQQEGNQTEWLLQAGKHQKTIAIGECGLDKFSQIPMDIQKTFFRMQIELSETLNKPLIIHCVKLFNELIGIKKEMKPAMPWILHGFNNNPAIASQCISEGICLSFGKSLLQKNSNACKAIKNIPYNMFFLETDDSPHNIKEVYQQCSKLRDIALHELKQAMLQNFNNYFKL